MSASAMNADIFANFSANVTLRNQTLQVQPAVDNFKIRLSMALSFAVCILMGLFGNGVLIAVLVKNRKFFGQQPFYVLVWQLIICDLLMSFSQIWVAIPITLAGKQIYGLTLWLYVPAASDTISFTASLLFTFTMTLNRFSIFLAKPVDERLFTKPKINLTVAAVWAWVFFLVLNSNLIGCTKTFSSVYFYYFYKCSQLSAYGGAFMDFVQWQSYVLPVVMFVMYVIMLVHIKQQSAYVWTQSAEYKKQRKRDINLFIQALIICGVLEIQSIVFTFLRKTPVEGDWEYLLTAISNCTIIINNAINPYIYFVFNQEIRTRTLVMFGISTKQHPSQSAVRERQPSVNRTPSRISRLVDSNVTIF